jgi:Reverse transcriptase (RNA-dependent DNA polymerase)
VEFFPHNELIPKLSPHEATIIAAEALAEALQQRKRPVNLEVLLEPTKAALLQLQQYIHPPTLSEATSDELPRVRGPPRVNPTMLEPTLPTINNQPIAKRTRSGGVQAQVPNFYASAVAHPITGKLMEYRQLISDPATRNDWQLSAANEFGRLAQGVGGRIRGTNTITFIPHHEMPADRQATYPRFVCTERPQKQERNRTRMTVGGNLITYPGDKSTCTAELETTKILFNSVVSTKDAKFCTMDITNFYLNTPLDRPEYLCIPVTLIPDEIMREYQLQRLVKNGNVLARIDKGMYGLPQAGILANKLLRERLMPHGYRECDHTPGLWKHHTRKLIFSLVVDNFGVQYNHLQDAQHLLAALKQHYEAITVDWTRSLFCGISLKWDYTNRTVDLSMPGYVNEALIEFGHPQPSKPEHQPHRHNPPQFGVKTQLTEPLDDSKPLHNADILRLQQITGKFLYYSRAVDATMNVALSSLASQQTKATQRTAQDATKFLNYCATHPTASLRYYASDMILKVHSDASYNSEPQARSRVGGHFYMGKRNDDNDTNQGAILATTAIMQAVLSSASEAEIGALYENTKKAAILRVTLEEMGYPQPATPVQTDNSTTCGIANDNIKQQRSRAIDMRFYWVRDRVRQGQFNIHWKPGKVNLADYYTKHHSAAHHQQVRPLYLHMDSNTSPSTDPIAAALHVLRGCVKPAPRHSVLPRVQGIQNIHSNAPGEMRTIAPACPAARSQQRRDGDQPASL